MMRTGNRGIALMEVLIAVTVLGVGMGVALQSLSNSSRLQSMLSRKAEARRLASDQLLRLESTGALMQNGITSGDFAAPDDGFSWKLKVLPSITSPERRRAELTILAGDNDSPVYTLTSYVLE